MNKTRILGLLAGAIVIVAIILISLGFKAVPSALGSTKSYLGMGDLHRYEALQADFQ